MGLHTLDLIYTLNFLQKTTTLVVRTSIHEFGVEEGINSQSIAVTYEQNPMSAMENLQVSTLKHVRKLGNWVKTLK